MGLMSVGGSSNVVGAIALFFQWEKYDTVRGDFAPLFFSSGKVQNYGYDLSVAKDCTVQFHFLRNSPNGFWLQYKVNANSNVGISEGTTVSLKKGDAFRISYGRQSSGYGDSYFMLTAKTTKK